MIVWKQPKIIKKYDLENKNSGVWSLQNWIIECFTLFYCFYMFLFSANYSCVLLPYFRFITTTANIPSVHNFLWCKRCVTTWLVLVYLFENHYQTFLFKNISFSNRCNTWSYFLCYISKNVFSKFGSLFCCMLIFFFNTALFSVLERQWLFHKQWLKQVISFNPLEIFSV